MTNDAPHFDKSGTLVAPRYEDVYFSVADGLAETRYVFIQGNDLPRRFAAIASGKDFTIGETGFGTGLNFLAAWEAFDKHAPADACLEFVSVEGMPLSPEVMQQALEPWPELSDYAQALLGQYGPLWPGMHRLTFAQGRVRLTLLVGEASEALVGLDASVDAWFLDGFAPSRNPAMWSAQVFDEVARCSAAGATLATYTAAGFVRRGLQAVGYEIQKQPGFGTKRDMTVGCLPGGDPSEEGPETELESEHASLTSAEGESDLPQTMTDDAGSQSGMAAPLADKQQGDALVIGGALAGAFTANALARLGLAVTVIERQTLVDGELPSLAPRIAVVQPKINHADDKPGRLLREGYAHVERRLRTDLRDGAGIDWQACGTFHASVDERAERRLRRFVEQFGEGGRCRWIQAEQTEDELGVVLPVGGVVIDSAGILRPAGLCAALLDHPNITVRDNAEVESLERVGEAWRVAIRGADAVESSTVVVANAFDAKRFAPTEYLDLRPVRGQATLLRDRDQAGSLSGVRRALFYGGYLTPAIRGVQMLGASFVPGDTDLAWRDTEHSVVCDQLAKVLPSEAERLRSVADVSGWVGLRMTTPTSRAFAEEIQEGLYVSLGHGSYGIASAAISAEILADSISARI